MKPIIIIPDNNSEELNKLYPIQGRLYFTRSGGVNINLEHLNNTALLNTEPRAELFKEAVDILKNLNLDGETTEYLIGSNVLNQEEQLFGQLLRKRIVNKEIGEAFEILSQYL